MKRSLAVAAAALFASSGIAYADSADGVISEIDWEQQTLTLDTGETFVVPQNELTQLSIGDQVIVTFADRDGQMFAESIAPSAADPDVAAPGVAPQPTAGTAGVTAAAPGSIQGIVTLIDLERQTIRLDTGEEFVVPEHQLTQLNAGDRVVVTVEERDGQRFARDVGPDTGVAAAPATGAEPTGVFLGTGTVDGTIALIDWERQIIELDTGERFVVEERELTDLETGDQVVVGFEERDGQVVAHSVTPMGDSERSSPGDAPGADPTGAQGSTVGGTGDGVGGGDGTTGEGAQQ